MSFLDNVICPISNEKINSYISRLTVFINAVLILLYVLTGIPYFMVVVTIDYGIRAIGNPKYSPIKWVAEQVVRATGLKEKLIDQAPKLFASRVGFAFAFVSVVLMLIATTPSVIVASVLLVFAFLDSVVDICVGCITYSYLILPFYKSKGIR